MKKNHLKQLLPVVLLMIVALGMRLPLLTGSFWMDEAAQALESARPLSQQLNIAQDFQPPLIHLLVHGAIQLTHSEWWLRTIASLIPGLLTVYLTYHMGKILFSERAGIIASTLLATSSFHIFYSQELRPYSLPALWAITSSFLLWQWLHSKQHTHLIWFALSTALGLYSTYLYPFLVFFQIVYVLTQETKRGTRFIGALAGSALLFAFWIPSFLNQLNVGTALRTELPGWENVVGTPQLKAIALVFAKFLYGVADVRMSLYFLVTAFAVVFLSLLVISSLRSSHWLKKEVIFALLWFALPLLSSWLISFIVPVIQPKRVLFLLPAFYLLFGYLVDRALTHSKTLINNGGRVLIGVLFLMNLWSTIQYYRTPQLQRENWRALHTEIVTRYGQKRAIAVFAFYEPFAPWLWYDDGSFTTWTLEGLQVTPEELEKVKVVTEYEYVLLFDYLRDLTDPQNQLPLALQSLGFKEIDTIDYPNIGFVRVYSRQKPVASLE